MQVRTAIVLMLAIVVAPFVAPSIPVFVILFVFMVLVVCLVMDTHAKSQWLAENPNGVPIVVQFRIGAKIPAFGMANQKFCYLEITHIDGSEITTKSPDGRSHIFDEHVLVDYVKRFYTAALRLGDVIIDK